MGFILLILVLVFGSAQKEKEQNRLGRKFIRLGIQKAFLYLIAFSQEIKFSLIQILLHFDDWQRGALLKRVHQGHQKGRESKGFF